MMDVMMMPLRAAMLTKVPPTIAPMGFFVFCGVSLIGIFGTSAAPVESGPGDEEMLGLGVPVRLGDTPGSSSPNGVEI
jgi:hypothetical protein